MIQYVKQLGIGNYGKTKGLVSVNKDYEGAFTNFELKTSMALYMQHNMTVVSLPQWKMIYYTTAINNNNNIYVIFSN